MTIHKVTHPRGDVDTHYAPRKEEGGGLVSQGDIVDALIQRPEDYKEKHKGGLITAINNDSGNTMDIRMTRTWKQKLEEKQLYGRFK